MWERVLRQLGLLLGPHGYEEASVWVEQSVAALYCATVDELHPGLRRQVLEKTIRVTQVIDDLWFDVDHRKHAQAAFAEQFGVKVDGPAWRLSPSETDRPTYEWVTSSDFTEPPTAP